jgi:hypothetical protein
MTPARTALALLLLLLAFPLTAKASYDPVGGGAARLQLDKRFRAFLLRDRVQVVPAGGAERHGGTIVFDLSGGSVDPLLGKGEFELAGSMIFRDARKRVPLRRLELKTTRSPLVGKVGGSQLKVASAGKLQFRRHGFDSSILASQLWLTAKVATRLNKKLHPPFPFAAGQIVGSLTWTAKPSVTAVLPTGRAELVLDPGLMAKLERRFVAVNPIFPTEHIGGELTLSIIANGALSPDGSRGVLRTGGEIEFLKLGGGQIFFQELWFDLDSGATLGEVTAEPSPPFPGKLGQAPILTEGAGTVSSDPGVRTIGLSGVSLALNQTAATLFNQAFGEGSEEFRAGELLGVLSFTATGQ